MPNVFTGGVTFGGVSIGEAHARLGLTVDRGTISLEKADELFSGRRLTGRVVLGRLGDANGQKTLADVDHEVAGTFDVKGFRVSADSFGLGFTFNLKEIDIAELAKFSKGQGRVEINHVTEIPDEPKERNEKSDHVPGTLRAEGPWRGVNLDQLFDPAKTIRKALAAADINTVGQLADYTASEKRLTDIAGIGEGKATDIEDRLLDFWQDNEGADKES